MGKFFAKFGGASGGALAALVAGGLIVAGYLVQSARNGVETAPQTVAIADLPVAVEPEGAAAESVAEAGTPQTISASQEPQADPAAPVFDEVRRAGDGVTVIAGRAMPDAQVDILQNGDVIASTKADGAGKFATLAKVPPDGRGHVLSLTAEVNGQAVPSADEIILAPTLPSASVAEQLASSDTAAVEGDNSTASVSAQAETETETDTAAVEVAPSDNAPAVENAQAADAKTPEIVTASSDPATNSPQPPASGDAPQDNDRVAPAQVDSTTDTARATDATKPATVAVLKSTAAGVELLNTPKPEAMTTVALDTISYSEGGEVELAGRAQNETASVRVYLDNRSVVSLPVDDKGRWRGALPDVDAGIYTLRVDEVSQVGKVTSRVETPFKRESAEVLLAAAPKDNSPISAITVQEGATLWAIARDRYGDGALYVRVFEANTKAIRDPDLIYPGQIFDLPD